MDSSLSIIPCVSWVSFFWVRIRGFFVQNTTVDLPYEIIADILSRLPAERVFHCVHACKPLNALTMTPHFVNIHQSRATPVIAFHYYLRVDYDHGIKNSAQEVNIYFTDDITKEIVTKSVKIDLDHACRNRTCCSAFLYGSCDGFLLFRNLMYDSVLFIWNPITEEQAILVAPHTGYRIRGFFFHAAAKEYRALYVSLKGQGFDFEYFILSLRTKSTRQISSYSYSPGGFRNPVFLNDVLHWMVGDKSYKRAHGVYPHCSNAILLFNIYSEEFSTMSHPGGECCMRGDHFPMILMENEGILCLCDASSRKELVVWILEDYEKKVWVKRYVIKEPLKMFGVDRSCEADKMVLVWHMHKDDILVDVSCRDLFLFNLTRGTFRRVGKKCRDLYVGVSPVCHVNTLATLHTDKVVKLHVEEKAI